AHPAGDILIPWACLLSFVLVPNDTEEMDDARETSPKPCSQPLRTRDVPQAAVHRGEQHLSQLALRIPLDHPSVPSVKDVEHTCSLRCEQIPFSKATGQIDEVPGYGRNVVAVHLPLENVNGK